MLRSLRTLHHSQPRRVHAKRSGLRGLVCCSSLLSSLGVIAVLLARLGLLLRLAFALLHFEFRLLDAVAGTLVVELLVLGGDFGLAGFAVAATSCAVGWC